MKEQLLIVFVKNILLGKVKTRLASSIGKQQAFEVYKHLVEITERETKKLTGCDVHIYFSDTVIHTKWAGTPKFVQQGTDLGERMQQAFSTAFEMGYQRVIGIGSDLPELNAGIITSGFEQLSKHDTVFGPASDGGYYLIGMKTLHRCIFENKPWSTEDLLRLTLEDLHEQQLTVGLLPELNDVDTLEDLQASSIAPQFAYLWQ